MIEGITGHIKNTVITETEAFLFYFQLFPQFFKNKILSSILQIAEIIMVR